MISRKINSIIERYQDRFRPENYGYAHAIENGRLKVAGTRLAVENPPLSFARPLTSFSCDSASALITRELTREGLTACIVTLDLPVAPAETAGTIIHKVCLAVEDERSYIVGLAAPLDQFLGLFPFKKLEEAPWILKRLEQQGINPFVQSPDADILELPAWDLSGIDPMVKPLNARVIGPDKFGLIELGLGLARQRLYVVLVKRILSFDCNRSSAVLEWNEDNYLCLPLEHLRPIAEGIVRSAADPQNILRGLADKNWAFREERKTNAALRDQGQALLTEAWPAVAAFFTKLPIEDIQALTL